MHEKLWKFLNSRDIPYFFESNTIKISSNYFYAQRYRQMEIKNEFINDPHEGVSVWVQRSDINSDTATINERAAITLAGSFMGIDPRLGSNNVFSNNVIVTETPTFHMMCFTTGSPDISKEVFCRRYDGISDPYDSCIEFHDIDALFRHVANNGLIKDSNGEFSIEVGRVFRSVSSGDVQYAERSVGWDESEPIASPYHKDVLFELQKEHRLVFEGGISNLPDELFIYVPRLSEFIALVDLS